MATRRGIQEAAAAIRNAAGRARMSGEHDLGLRLNEAARTVTERGAAQSEEMNRSWLTDFPFGTRTPIHDVVYWLEHEAKIPMGSDMALNAMKTVRRNDDGLTFKEWAKAAGLPTKTDSHRGWQRADWEDAWHRGDDPVEYRRFRGPTGTVPSPTPGALTRAKQRSFERYYEPKRNRFNELAAEQGLSRPTSHVGGVVLGIAGLSAIAAAVYFAVNPHKALGTPVPAPAPRPAPAPAPAAHAAVATPAAAAHPAAPAHPAVVVPRVPTPAEAAPQAFTPAPAPTTPPDPTRVFDEVKTGEVS